MRIIEYANEYNVNPTTSEKSPRREFYCNSSETKPSANTKPAAHTGDWLVETDTSMVYTYDETNDEWVPFGEEA